MSVVFRIPTTRLASLVAFCLLGLVGGVASAIAQMAERAVEINLPAGDLADSLDKLGDQSGVQIMYEPALAKGIKAPAVSGTLTVSETLKRLLARTGLRADRVNDKTVVLKRETHSNTPSPRSGEGKGEVDKTNDVETNEVLESIIVTAQKRSERLLDVPVPVSVLDNERLATTNQVALQDYYSTVPNLTMSTSINGSLNLAIRGISTPSQGSNVNPTVGITVDDVPYGGSWLYGQSGFIPEIDPGELARIEVLRGPQGTLYGASSIGGLLKFVTIDPSTSAFTGRLEAGTSTVFNGAELGYNFRGSANIPVSDDLAVRLSAFTRQDPGYIDNPILHIRGINEDHDSGGRFALLWSPSNAVSLKLSALYQDMTAHGSAEVMVPTAGYPPGYPSTAGLGDLQQNLDPGNGLKDRSIQAYSATVHAKLGNVDLTSITGYNINHISSNSDLSFYLASYTQSHYGGTPDSLSVDDYTTRKFNQEIRLSSSIGSKIDWVAGGYYTTEYSAGSDPAAAVDPTTGAIRGFYFYDNAPGTFFEYAAFGDLTFHITDQFDVQVGGREAGDREIFKDTSSGALENNTTVFQDLHANGNVFTYLLTPRLKLSPDMMVYARLASGYRPGGPNSQVNSAIFGVQIPASFAPDKTYNYEIGAKGDFLNHKLSIDTSLYYIDWKNAQISVSTHNTSYFANATQAKSQGLELTIEAIPVDSLKLDAWITAGEAVLTAPLAANSGLYGMSGDRLPNTTRFSGNLSADYEFPVGAELKSFIGGTASYIGSRLGNFVATPERQDLPAYTKIDLRAGMKYKTWTASLYANNVADKRGIISGGVGTTFPFDFYYIQPRTIGLTVIKAF